MVFVRRLINPLFIVIFISVFCSQKENHINNARKFIREGNYDRALIEILKYREDKDGVIQYLLGYCYFKKNEYGQAKEHFVNALNIDSLFKDSIVNIYTKSARNALKISEPQKALQLYKTLADIIPDYKQADNLFLVADLNFQQDNYFAALTGYIRAFEIDSNSEMARKSVKNYIRSAIECDSLGLAYRLILKEYKRSKNPAYVLLLGEVNYLIGRKLYEIGMLDSAITFFKEVLTNQEPKSLIDDASFYLGEIFFHKEDFNKAVDYYKKVLRLNPYQKGKLVQTSQQRIKEIKEK